MTPLRVTAGRTFAAVSVRNYRLFFIGQLLSVSGTWMQSVAQVLLVLDRLHGNGFDVGVVTALQFLPMLLLGSFGGLVADRADKRRLLFFTQGAAGLLALTLAVLTLAAHVELWEVYLLATALGFVNLFDNPARQTFVSEMVGKELLPNAVSLNSVVMNSARVIGPAIGGILIVTVGIGVCFLVNAASYGAVLVALALMRTSELHPSPTAPRAKGQVREGLRYAWTTPELRDPLLAMAVVGIFAFNFTVTLPLLAKFSFGGGAGTYSAFLAAMGVGAVIGGLIVAHRARPSTALLSVIGVFFGVAILVVAVAPAKWFAIVALVFMGAGSISFISTANATLQLRADPRLRGRVMALFAIAFLGSTPIGAPLVGAISDATSPRVALLVGGVATLAASVPLGVRYLRLGRHAAVARSGAVPGAPGGSAPALEGSGSPA